MDSGRGKGEKQPRGSDVFFWHPRPKLWAIKGRTYEERLGKTWGPIDRPDGRGKGGLDQNRNSEEQCSSPRFH